MRFLPKIKFLVLSFTLFFLIFSFAFPLYAVEVVPPGSGSEAPAFSNPKLESFSLEKFQRAVFDEGGYNKESFDAQSTVDLMNTISTGIFGCVSTDPQVCPQDQTRGGAVELLAGAVGTMYAIPPASGVTYMADLGKRLNLVQPAYAKSLLNRAGTGYILSLWRAFRNATYVLFIVAFVALAFAIMFRAKLSPQIVITIQSALPRVIIALILITFSFAIAGLLLDFSYVLTGLITATFELASGGASWWQEIANATINTGMPTVVAATIVAIIGALGGSVVLPVVGTVAGVLGGAILGTVLMIAILAVLFIFATFRLTLMYLQAYVSLLIRIILGPLEILFNSLPGRPVFWGWFGGLLAEVSVFVTSYAVLSLGFALFKNLTPFTTLELTIFGGGTSGPDVPFPGVLSIQKPFLEILRGLIGLGILLMTPNIVNAVKEAIKRSVPLGAPAGLEYGITTGREAGLYRLYQGLPPAARLKRNIVYAIYQILGGRRT